jgi:uncharacterized spore protein YtfJ
MANPREDAKSEAEADVAASGDRFDRLVESLGGSASASAVFGDPVERDGVTVVPVARVRYGVGGGGGRGAGRRKKRDSGGAEQEVGYGHGGGVQAAPVGYIEISGGKADYKRIADPVRPLAALMLFPLVGVVCFALMAIISLQTAKSARKMLPAMPHVPLPSVRWND